jgi:predicted RNA-binding protein with PUA-like domain
MVAHWLVKQEPSSYSWKDLVAEGETEWNGVHNATALLHIRRMRVGDLAIFYHSGEERACVGILRVSRGPRPDPHDERGSWTVRVRLVRALRRPVTLSEIRGDPAFAGFDLLRISRLSVLPVSDAHWAALMALEGGDVEAPHSATEARSGRGRATGSPPRANAAKRRR